jgi:ankyrin repeat protein
MGALYYGESEGATHLARRGATLDLVAAAGVGDIETLRSILGDEDALEATVRARPGTPPSAHDSNPSVSIVRLAHYSRVAWPDHAERQDLLGLALAYAALHGRLEAIGLLLDAGADPNHRPPFDSRATALHRAAMGDHPEAIRMLLDAGADPSARDLEYHSTPLGWATYMRRAEAVEALA